MRRNIYRGRRLSHVINMFGMCSAVAFLNTTPLKSAIASETRPLTTVKVAKSVNLPKIISVDDERKYRRIFALQEKGKWREADKLIQTLNDDLLMGHIEAQRYLHPTKYRSRYIELSKWLKSHADHPDARRIYRLALRRKPKTFRAPQRPESRFYPSYKPSKIIENSGYRPSKKSAKNIIRQVRRMTYQRRLTSATRYISSKKGSTAT